MQTQLQQRAPENLGRLELGEVAVADGGKEAVDLPRLAPARPTLPLGRRRLADYGRIMSDWTVMHDKTVLLPAISRRLSTWIRWSGRQRIFPSLCPSR